MTPFEILLLAGVADVKLSRKPGFNIYKIGFMLKNGQDTIFFYHFYPQNSVFVQFNGFCVSFTFPRPKRRAEVGSKIITRLENLNLFTFSKS